MHPPRAQPAPGRTRPGCQYPRAVLDSSAPAVSANDFVRQWEEIRADALGALDRVGRSGWLVLGKEVREFEDASRRMVGS